MNFFVFCLVFLFFQTGLGKTICTRRQYVISNSNFYQRIELPSAVTCVERCIENADYCKSVIFVEQSKPRKRFCQLYGVNSESKSIRIRPEANYEPKVTLYELIDDCPSGYPDDTDEDDVASRIATNLKRILEKMPKSSHGDYGTGTKEVDLTVIDDVHRPVFDAENRNHFEGQASGTSFSAKPEYPFNSKHSTEAFEDSSFHAERDPVPIRPVSVSHAGQPVSTAFGTSYAQGSPPQPPPNFYPQPQSSPQPQPFGRYPCFGPNCRPPPFYPQPQQSPCAAIRRGDPCAPKPRCGPSPLKPCESYSLPEKVIVETAPARPYWTEWSPVGTCSVTCGHGTRQRRRFCSSGKESDCEGAAIQEDPCDLPECDLWSEWGSWTACPVTCGGGEQQRTRYCRNGRNCVGPSSDRQTCADVECPHWSEWNSWHECSASCGPGLAKRSRECLPLGSFACLGSSQDHQNCELRPCPEWGLWLQWTECTKSCDGGERQRIRECLHGSDCRGPAEEHILCNQQKCPEWSGWSFWSPCTATCGDEGTRLRTRQCTYEGFPSNLCEGTAQDQSACQLEQCPYWDVWTEWSTCTATCGHGQQTRARKCQPRGYGCQGGDKELKFCQLAVCPFYDTWSEWGGCSVTCGRGHCERTRKCVKNEPLPGAVLPSEDELEEVTGRAEDATNNNRRAALKGRLIERAHLLETRKRVNDQQIPRNRSKLQQSGLDVTQSNDRRLAPRKNSTKQEDENPDTLECVGPAVDRKECDAGPCCDWSSWASWSSCNAQCGTGSKIRSRICQVDVGYTSLSTSANFGQYQVDPNFVQQPWNRQTFPGNVQPIHPQVSMRGKRQAWNLPPRGPTTYVTPAPTFSFKPDSRCNCEGPSTETEVCTSGECLEAQIDPCTWSPWSSWCSCSGNCQQGIKARTRFCNREGSSRRCDCSGEKVQTQECIPDNCRNGKARESGREHDSIVEKSEISLIGHMSMARKKNHQTNEDPSDFIIKSGDDSQVDEEEDEVTSCRWSDWSDWGPCNKSDFLKQRTRFCVGLKALIKNCECRGSTMEQTSCLPERDGHNFKPPSKAVLEVSRDILREKLATNGHKQHDDALTILQEPKTKIRPVTNSSILASGPRLLSGSDLITASDNDKHFLEFEDSDEKCVFNEWESWSKCDVDCGEGERQRRRTCPCQFCQGISTEIETCFSEPCLENFDSPISKNINPFD